MSLTLLGIEDPIEEAFPLMVAAAERSCQDRNQPVRPCYSYHRLWPYQRMLGLKGSAWRHGKNYIACFSRFARDGRTRLLISGAGDYAMLSMALKGYRDAGVEPDITVIDLCDAPLTINRWYAQRQHARIKTEACSIFDYHNPAAFDVVATDQFLSQFPQQLCGRVVHAWHEMLVAGGKVITAQGFGGGDERRVNKRQREKLENITDDRIEALGIDRATLERYFREFQMSRNRHHFRDAPEVEQLFLRHGFAVELLGQIPPGFEREAVPADTLPPPRRMFFEATRT